MTPPIGPNFHQSQPTQVKFGRKFKDDAEKTEFKDLLRNKLEINPDTIDLNTVSVQDMSRFPVIRYLKFKWNAFTDGWRIGFHNGNKLRDGKISVEEFTKGPQNLIFYKNADRAVGRKRYLLDPEKKHNKFDERNIPFMDAKYVTKHTQAYDNEKKLGFAMNQIRSVARNVKPEAAFTEPSPTPPPTGATTQTLTD